jgi:hypothetical protein
LIATGFKNSPTIFRTALASYLKVFSANQHDCTLLQYIDDLLLAGPILARRTVWKGLASSFLFYERQNAKSLGKRPRFAKTLSNTSDFNCSRGNAGSVLGGNRLYVPSQPPLANQRVFGSCRFLPNLDP